MSTIFLILTLLATVFTAKAASQEWLERRLGEIEAAKKLEHSERLDVLGAAVLAGYPTLPRPDKHQETLASEARTQIISIPGHAEHFGEKVTEYYDIVKEGYAEGKSFQEIIQWHAYTKNSTKAFQILSLLPSAETVSVLGEMLEDDWKWPEFDNPSVHEPDNETLASRAMIYLMRLPIANPPTGRLRNSRDRADNVHLWKQWYKEIESGRRTFRFIGDDTEYDLRGPVRRGGTVADRSGNRTEAAETEEDKGVDTAGPAPEPLRFLPYLIGGLFLLAGIFYYLRGKRNAA